MAMSVRELRAVLAQKRTPRWLRLGLGVSRDSVRAVLVREGTVLWHAERVVGDQSLREVIEELVGMAPLTGWRRPPVIAAVGPVSAQARLLSGLPPIDAGALRELVRESAGRFFLRNGVPLVTTGVRLKSEGEGWAGAIERPVVEAIEAACQRHRLRLAAVLPAIMTVGHGLPDDTVEWPDGEVRARLTRAHGLVRSISRIIVDDEAETAHPLVAPALAALGADGWRYADAYGAALSSPNDTMAYTPVRSWHTAGGIPRWRLVLASSVLTITIVVAFTLPMLLAARRADRATQVLAQLAAQRRSAIAKETSVDQIARAVATVREFERSRRSQTALLAAITRVLPERSAIVMLRSDSAGVTLVALAPRAALLLSRLEHVPGIAGASVVGPVTREVSGAVEVERVTVRSHWADGQSVGRP
jgi:hypothetical protein